MIAARPTGVKIDSEVDRRCADLDAPIPQDILVIGESGRPIVAFVVALTGGRGERMDQASVHPITVQSTSIFSKKE